MLHRLKRVLTDPAPDFAFEISEAGIAWVRPLAPSQPGWEPLEKDVLHITPLRDNVVRSEVLGQAVRRITGANGTRKRRRAVLILPDYCARVAVLDFDNLPGNAEEQLSLVRFRMKKSVPFDVESAMIRFFPQQAEPGSNRLNVVVVVAALEILARYEAPFRAAGLHAGLVTTSTLAALELDNQPGISLLARLSGRVLSAAVVRDGILKLLRTVELHDITSEEMLAVLFPTVAYIEDELEARPQRVLICGVDAAAAVSLEAELAVPVEPLKSRWGTPGQFNAGLLGYLESLNV